MKAESWAAGISIVEACGKESFTSGGHFFDGNSQLKIAQQIKDYCTEMMTGISGPVLKKLGRVLERMDVKIRKPVVDLIHYLPAKRLKCDAYEGWVNIRLRGTGWKEEGTVCGN